MREYAHLDSWSAILQGVFASHSQKPRRDILGASSQSTKNRILNLEVRQGVLISVEHQIVNNRRTLPSSSFRAGFSVTSRQQAGARQRTKASSWHPAISPEAALLASSLSPGQEKSTMRETEAQ